MGKILDKGKKGSSGEKSSQLIKRQDHAKLSLGSSCCHTARESDNENLMQENILHIVLRAKYAIRRSVARVTGRH